MMMEAILEKKGYASLQHLGTDYMRKAQRLCAISGAASPPLNYKYTGAARAKKAPLVWSCCKTSRR